MDKILIPSRKKAGKALHIQTAFILSAGLGERLWPITNHIPKPLLPILGKPVLELILEKVSPFANTIAINLHHKKESIARYINNSPFKGRTNIFYEESILGTGGALKNAEALLSKGAFLVHNGDILSDMDLERLVEFHLSSKNIATLAVHDYKQFNNLEIDENGYLKGVIARRPEQSKGTPKQSQGRDRFASLAMTDKEGENGKRLAFTGIAVYEPEFLKFLLIGISSVVDAWLRAKDAGCPIGTMDVSGSYWTDIGTPSAYAAAVVNALRISGETIYINSDAECGDVEMDGYVAIEKGCKVSGSVFMRNCIVLPESKVANTSYENCILCGDIKIDLNESEMLGFQKNEDVLIGVGGSDRRYYRRRKDKQTEVFVRYAQNDADFHRHIEFTKFFRKYNIPVPELIDVDYKNMTALFEDLGDLSLYSWLKCRRKEEQTEKMYRSVLDIIIELHTTVTSHSSECPMLQERVFDYEHARWETNYFMEEFIKGVEGIKTDTNLLNDEFHKLALKADSFPKTIIHRDFQSQNIMVKKDIPRLIDYQGARLGPPAYDVASILYDPYFRLEEMSREILLDYYIQQMKKKSGGKFKEADFIESLKVCRLQRHMQALGAYGFLSSKKGKAYFLKHMPEGLRLLKEDILHVKSEYPALYELVSRL